MATETTEVGNPALQAIHTQRGLSSKIAKRLKITRSAVWMWKRVPPQHAVIVAEMLNLPVHHVCPEVFPPPQQRPITRAKRKTQPAPEAQIVKHR